MTKNLSNMKKVLSTIAIIGVALFFLSFTYSVGDSKKSMNLQVDVREVNVAGHKYVVATSYESINRNQGGVSIIHSAGCYCNNK